MKCPVCGEEIAALKEICRKCGADNFKRAAASYEKGVVNFSKGDFAAAMVFFDDCIGHNPDDSDAWFYRGLTACKLGNAAEEMKSYDEALRVDPAHADAWHEKGVALLREIGKFGEANECFQKARRIREAAEKSPAGKDEAEIAAPPDTDESTRLRPHGTALVGAPAENSGGKTFREKLLFTAEIDSSSGFELFTKRENEGYASSGCILIVLAAMMVSVFIGSEVPFWIFTLIFVVVVNVLNLISNFNKYAAKKSLILTDSRIIYSDGQSVLTVDPAEVASIEVTPLKSESSATVKCLGKDARAFFRVDNVVNYKRFSEYFPKLTDIRNGLLPPDVFADLPDFDPSTAVLAGPLEREDPQTNQPPPEDTGILRMKAPMWLVLLAFTGLGSFIYWLYDSTLPDYYNAGRSETRTTVSGNHTNAGTGTNASAEGMSSSGGTAASRLTAAAAESLESYKKGASLESASMFEEALKCYEKAIELDQTNAKAWFKKGYFIFEYGTQTVGLASQYPPRPPAPVNEILECFRNAYTFDHTISEAFYNYAVAAEFYTFYHDDGEVKADILFKLKSDIDNAYTQFISRPNSQAESEFYRSAAREAKKRLARVNNWSDYKEHMKNYKSARLLNIK